MGEIYRSAFNKTTLITGATVAVNAGIFQKLGEYKVLAGELVSVGFGNRVGQEGAQGRIYIKLQNATPTQLQGTLRLSAYTAQDRPIEILGEWRTETLDTDAKNRTLMVELPEDDLWVSQDKKIVLEFKCDTSDTVSQAQSTILLDVTKAVV